MDLPAEGVVTAVAFGFMVLLALINLRGVGESVKFNVVLTLVEVTALCTTGAASPVARGDADIGEVTVFTDYQDKGLFLAVTAATSIAFFAMVGFEDAVNMVEETHDPQRIFPWSMLTGLGIAVILYMLVAVSVVAAAYANRARRYPVAVAPCWRLLSKGSPDFLIDRVFPFLACFAVANTALINMLMASRLLWAWPIRTCSPRSPGEGVARPVRHGSRFCSRPCCRCC